MFYWLDSDYREADKQYDQDKKKRDKLEKIKDDIMNDTSSINRINNYLGDIYENFEKAVKVSTIRNRVANKINTLREPYQSSDGNLRTACDYIDSERRLLWNEMQKAETKKEKIKDKY